MALSELLQKMANGEKLSELEKSTMLLEARRLEEVASLVTSLVKPGTSTLSVDHLVANDAVITNAEITNATITDGVLDDVTAGSGNVHIWGSGIDIIEDLSGNSWLSFYDTDGVTKLGIIATSGNGLYIGASQTDGTMVFALKLNDATTPQFTWKQDPIQANRTFFDISDGVQGSRFQMGQGAIDFRTEGTSGGYTFLRVMETTNTPADAAGNDAFHMYMKGNKLIVQSQGGAYFYLDLTATSNQSWIYSASAP